MVARSQPSIADLTVRPPQLAASFILECSERRRAASASERREFLDLRARVIGQPEISTARR